MKKSRQTHGRCMLRRRIFCNTGCPYCKGIHNLIYETGHPYSQGILNFICESGHLHSKGTLNLIYDTGCPYCKGIHNFMYRPGCPYCKGILNLIYATGHPYCQRILHLILTLAALIVKRYSISVIRPAALMVKESQILLGGPAAPMSKEFSGLLRVWPSLCQCLLSAGSRHWLFHSQRGNCQGTPYFTLHPWLLQPPLQHFLQNPPLHPSAWQIPWINYHDTTLTPLCSPLTLTSSPDNLLPFSFYLSYFIIFPL